MIFLDTSIIFEPMCIGSPQLVQGWLNKQSIDTLYLSSITVARVRACIDLLPNEDTKFVLANEVERLLLSFTGRILPFDAECAKYYASLAAQPLDDDVVMNPLDTLFVASTIRYGFAVATLYPVVFAGTGVEVINPNARR